MSDILPPLPVTQPQQTPAPQPVTLDNAFSVGFVAGLGFIFAQLIVGGALWGVWWFMTTPVR